MFNYPDHNEKKDPAQLTDGSRRNFIRSCAIGVGSLIIGGSYALKAASLSGTGPNLLSAGELIRAYCIDFNWGPGGINAFAKPGLWADAVPREHINWYKALGCNVIQTFAVSCNGYAWYKKGIIPVQPGLKYDFLPEMVKLGHEENMKVFGYFCVGANTKWGLEHPDLSYGTPAAPHIPFTTQYLDYLCSSVEDALEKSNMDGFMIDWVWNPRKLAQTPHRLEWLPCEQVMFHELMNRPFPGMDKMTPEIEQEFCRKAIDRCWKRIRESAKSIKPDCIIWLSCSDVENKDVTGSAMFKQVDWLMNEAGDMAGVESVRNMVGTNTRLITCLANWNGQDATKVVPRAIAAGIGIYGFTKPRSNSLPAPVDWYLSRPVDSLKGDDQNIAMMARAYHGLPADYIKGK